MNIIGFIRSAANNGLLCRRTWRLLADKTTVEQDMIDIIQRIERQPDDKAAIEEAYTLLRQAYGRRMGL